MDQRLLKWNYNESLTMSFLEILCSLRSSCVLRLRRFVVEVLQGFKGLNSQSFADLWFIDVFGGFWAWFQQTLGSRQIVWMILLRVFFEFEVEILENFEAWFLQSFCTSESWSLNPLGRLLFIGVWGWVSDTWRSLIGDTCHSLIGLPMSSLTRTRPLVSSLTRVGLLVSSLTCADVWLVFCMTLGKHLLVSK